MEFSEVLPERLQRRERDLQLERQRKRQDKDQEDSNRKAVNLFLEQFGKTYLEIENALNKISSGLVDNELVPSTLSSISKDIQTLQKYFSGSTIILCLHDVRKCQERIHSLQHHLQELEEKFFPKKKFGFKTKKNKIKEALQVHTEDHVDAGAALKKLLIESDFGVKSRVNETIVMHANSVSGKDVVLQNLTGCIVKLFGTPSSLHITDVQNCTIFSGPILRSVFIENCQESKFVIACQQLRIHLSHHCDFYLYVTSRVIIEDTDSIRVAPYNWTYDGIEEDFSSNNWDLKVNHWNLVDDFNWLAIDKPSPNWSILKETDRIVNWL